MAVPGAGDIAHVYLLELGPDLAHEETDYVTYDDATQQLLAVKGGHVFAYDISKGPVGHTALKWMYPLQEGPRITGLRPSLDNRMLALQRSPAMLELVDLATGMCFVHSIHQGRGDILAFFFTDAPDTDLVIVTSRAVELTQFAARRQGLRCRERIRGSNAWAIYTHETRMVVVGSAAAPGSALSAWQFASHGIVHLPLFELQGPLPSSAAVRQFLHGSAATAAISQQQQQQDTSHSLTAQLVAGSAAAAGAHYPGGHPPVSSSSSAPVAAAAAAGPAGSSTSGAAAVLGTHRGLDPGRLWLLKMYGRVYLAHADSAGCRLELYRFYTDTIILQHVYDLCSPQVQLSVVDNTLVVHHTDTSVVMLYDVSISDAGCGGHLVNPLPLRKLTLLPPALAAAVSREDSRQLQEQQQQQGAEACGNNGSSNSLSRAGSRALLRAGSSGGVAGSSSATAAGAAEGEVAADGGGGEVYEASEAAHSPSWRWFMPSVILDTATKSIGRLQLDLQAIADSAEDWPALVGFLMRRHSLPPAAPLTSDPRSLLIQVSRNVLQVRLSLAAIRQIFGKLLQAYADTVARTAAPTLAAATAAAAAAGGAAAGSAPSAHRAPLLEVPAVTVITPRELARDLFQWVHDEEVVDALYLQAAVGEYCAASDAVGVPPPPYLQLLAVDLLLQQEQHYQAVQLLYSQPGTSSTILAQHLLDIARKDGLAVAAAAPGPGASPFLAAAGEAGAGLPAAAGAVRRISSFDAGNPGSAMALELAMDVLSRMAVPELRSHGSGSAPSAGVLGAGAAGAAAAAVVQGAQGGHGCRAPAAAALVRQLLAMGQALQAARIARAAGGPAAVGLPAGSFLEVAAASRDLGAFAAVYRAMRGQLVGSWPDLEAARQYFWGAGDVAAGAGAAAPAMVEAA